MLLSAKTIVALSKATDLIAEAEDLQRQATKILGEELEPAWDDWEHLHAIIALMPWCVQKAFAIEQLSQLKKDEEDA